jgi:hypothetical protein
MALKVACLGLFGIVCAKDAFVANHREISRGSIQWNASFARAAHDWKVDDFTLFSRMLYLGRVRWEGDDKLWWIPSKRGLFGVQSFNNVMSCVHAILSRRSSRVVGPKLHQAA